MKRLEVFAVEDHAVQVTWGEMPEGTVRISAGTATAVVESDGSSPGAVTLEGLPSGRLVDVVFEAAGGAIGRARARTLESPPGPELFRLATINDLHIGADGFGYWNSMRERPRPAQLHPVRCAEAAVTEALAWGAQMLVVKGDLTHRGWPDQWEQVGRLLAGLPVPVEVVPGNHDASSQRTVEPQPGLARHGLHLVHGVQVVDLPGIRLVLADSVLPGENRGQIAHLTPEVARVARRAPGPVLLGLHHHPQRFEFPTFLPPGIKASEANAFLAAVAPLTVTEVGSTKDYPGAWGGYVVHEGGIRQVVRRIERPDCIRWTEYTRRAVLGLWGHWSPGRLDDRCFTIAW
jgi:hypothetical protein